MSKLHGKKLIVLIENVSFLSIVRFLIFCWRERIKRNTVTVFCGEISSSCDHKRRFRLFFLGQLLEQMLEKLVLKIIFLRFRPIKIFDKNGKNIGLSIFFLDQTQINLLIWRQLFGDVRDVQRKTADSWLKGYFSKSIFNVLGQSGTFSNHIDAQNIRKYILYVNAVSRAAELECNASEVVFLVKEMPFMSVFRDYSKARNVTLVGFTNYFSEFFYDVLFFFRIDWISRFIHLVSRDVIYSGYRSRKKISSMGGEISQCGSEAVVVDQVMEMFPATSFWGRTNIENAKLVFISMSHRLVKSSYDDIVKAGMHFVPMGPNIAGSLCLTRYIPNVRWKGLRKPPRDGCTGSREKRLIEQCTNEYLFEKNKFLNFFLDIGSRLYVTSQKWSPHQVAAASAMSEIGGISALWQVAYYDFVDPASTVFSDVFFSFCKNGLERETSSGSQVRYQVCVGYIGDYRFDLVRPMAIQLRQKVKSCGAKKIISYFDETSSDDGYWGLTHKEARNDYQFWLEKVLTEEWLGLIIKPKKASQLRANLGSVNELLNKAIDTGRCVLLETYYTPPAQAALASDIAIHDTLRAGTAGLESALSGTRTLMYDKNGWRQSQLYKLGLGRVVFNDWVELWESVLDSWRKSSESEIGDWSPFIADLDPFRDGRARDRMITYLMCIVDGIRLGLNKETNLEHAAEQYSKVWGADKIESNY